MPLRPVRVRTDNDGTPRGVFWRGRWRRVLQVSDCWLAEEGWWKGQEVQRLAFSLVLEGPVALTLYHDLVEDAWYV